MSAAASIRAPVVSAPRETGGGIRNRLAARGARAAIRLRGEPPCAPACARSSRGAAGPVPFLRGQGSGLVPDRARRRRGGRGRGGSRPGANPGRPRRASSRAPRAAVAAQLGHPRSSVRAGSRSSHRRTRRRPGRPTPAPRSRSSRPGCGSASMTRSQASGTSAAPQERVGLGERRVDHRRVVAPPAAPPERRDRRLPVARAWPRRRSHGRRARCAAGGRSRSPATFPGNALAVPALHQLSQRERHLGAHVETSCEEGRALAEVGGQQLDPPSRRRSSPPGSSRAGPPARAPRGRP